MSSVDRRAGSGVISWVGKPVVSTENTERAGLIVRALEARSGSGEGSVATDRQAPTEGRVVENTAADSPVTGSPVTGSPVTGSPGADSTVNAGRRPNIAYVPSPSRFLPTLDFTPTKRRPWRRPTALERLPGRYILLAAILLGTAPVVWSALQPPAESIEVAVPLEGPPVSLVVTSTGVEVSGTVSSPRMHDAVMTRVEEVLGPELLLDRLTIDESVRVDLTLPTPLELGDDVLFPVGASEILAPYEPLIATAARMLVADSALLLDVVGHTDSTGPADANLVLSVARAEAVRDALVDSGVEEAQIRPDGRGEDEPIASNEDDEGRALNRRVEFEVSGLLG